MAPVKPDTQRRRIAAARTVRAALDDLPSLDPAFLEDISTGKGLFTRSLKRDQCDWFTVWSQLGFPAHHVLGPTSEGFAHLRRALKTSNVTTTWDAVADLAVRLHGRRPGRGRRGQHRVVNGIGDGHSDRVGQPPATLGQPGEELMCPAGGVGADQRLPAAPILLGSWATARRVVVM